MNVKTLALLSLSFISLAQAQVTIGDKDFSRGSRENIHRGHNEIVLTFDDGPTPGVTEKMLDVLKEYNIKAAFFVVGKNVEAYPAIMKRMVNEGHIVANHSMTHTALKDLSFFTWKKKVRSEVYDAHEAMKAYMTNSKQFYFRAPEGAWDAKYAGYLNQDVLGKDYIGPVLWDIGGEMELIDGVFTKAADWACWSRKVPVEKCLEGYMNETKKLKGGVVLLHDLRSQSVEMVKKMIPALLDEGYTFKSLDDVRWE